MTGADKPPLYVQIRDAIRQQVLDGKLRPGDLLPPVREMAERWGCTPGTVQQAYKELARQGLAISQPGQGTRIGAEPLHFGAAHAALRRASLVNQAEGFLLEVLAAGYSPADAEAAFRAALDRWRAFGAGDAEPAAAVRAQCMRFAGSHDPAVSLIAARFPELSRGCTLDVAYPGSLGGLIALAEGKVDLAGCHLWDEPSDTYNAPFVRRLLPGRRVALLTLAHRRLGLIVPPGNPARLLTVRDLVQPGVSFVNRQRGAGTRVWLDAQLHRLGILPGSIAGYDRVVGTHTEVAHAVAEGRATAGMGVEAAALAYSLGFVGLTTERYDLAILAETWERAPVAALARWLGSDEARAAITGLGGYLTAETGRVTWVEW
jgi:molybdate-binding protein/DNA-binding transcriptional regulator YhcF (GntR family)